MNICIEHINTSLLIKYFIISFLYLMISREKLVDLINPKVAEFVNDLLSKVSEDMVKEKQM